MSFPARRQLREGTGVGADWGTWGWERGGGGKGRSRGAARGTSAGALPRRRPRTPGPRDSTNHGARGRPPPPAAAATGERAGERRPAPAATDPSPQATRVAQGLTHHLQLALRTASQPVTVSRPRGSLPFPGLPPPTSAGSASVRARKEGGCGAPGGSRTGPELPRLKSRGIGDRGRRKGVWAGGGRGMGDAVVHSVRYQLRPLVRRWEMGSVLCWMHRPVRPKSL